MKTTVRKLLEDLVVVLEKFRQPNGTLSVDTYTSVLCKIKECAKATERGQLPSYTPIEVLDKEVEEDPDLLKMIAVSLQMICSTNTINVNSVTRTIFFMILPKS